MRALLILLLAGTAHAGSVEIASDPPPPPPPPPPAPVVIAAEPAPPPPDRLADRMTFLAGSGMLWLSVDGTHGSGMTVQPTFTRTFDRFELQGEVALATWHADPGPMHALVGRLGATARYQAARLRIENTLALDAIVEAGAGFEHIARDTAAPLSRPDLALGVGFRMLGRDDAGSRRLLVGLEVMARAIVAPGDHGWMIVFGLPVGR